MLFPALNALEQFLLLRTEGVEVAPFLRQKFLHDQQKARLTFEERQAAILHFVNQQGAALAPHVQAELGARTQATAEQTFAGRVSYAFAAERDELFAQLLAGDVAFPLPRQRGPEAQRLLLAFLFGAAFSVGQQTVPVKEAGAMAKLAVQYAFDAQAQHNSSAPLRHCQQTVRVTVANKTQGYLTDARVFVSVEGAEVVQTLPAAPRASLGPGQEASLAPFVLFTSGQELALVTKVVHGGEVVFSERRPFSLRQTQTQSEEAWLAARLQAGQFQMEDLLGLKTVPPALLAQVLLSLKPELAPQVVAHQFRCGYANEHLVAQTPAAPRAAELLKHMYLNRALPQLKPLYLHRLAPVREVHPYVKSRVLGRPQDMPEQLRRVLRAQMQHSFFCRDLENLFVQAVLLDDFELAGLLFERCAFAPRHQQLVDYYRCAIRAQAAYPASEQFNTFSAESAAKYGKISEQPVPLRAALDQAGLRVENNAGEAVQVLVVRRERQSLLECRQVAADSAKALFVGVRELDGDVVIVRNRQVLKAVDNKYRVRVVMKRMAGELVRFVDQGTQAPARVFVEVVAGGRVVQAGYADLLGFFRPKARGALRVGDQEWVV